MMKYKRKLYSKYIFDVNYEIVEKKNLLNIIQQQESEQRKYRQYHFAAAVLNTHIRHQNKALQFLLLFQCCIAKYHTRIMYLCYPSYICILPTYLHKIPRQLGDHPTIHIYIFLQKQLTTDLKLNFRNEFPSFITVCLYD